MQTKNIDFKIEIFGEGYYVSTVEINEAIQFPPNEDSLEKCKHLKSFFGNLSLALNNHP